VEFAQDSVPAADALERVIATCRGLIKERFNGKPEHGAAAVLLGDGSILTGTSPDFPNPSTTVCHETEPYLAAFRLGQPIVASVCLHKNIEGQFLVLSPCGICQERLVMHGTGTLVGVPNTEDFTRVQWVPLESIMPRHWLSVF